MVGILQFVFLSDGGTKMSYEGTLLIIHKQLLGLLSSVKRISIVEMALLIFTTRVFFCSTTINHKL